MRSRNRRRDGPKAEKENNSPKDHRPNIDNNTKNTRKVERSPDKLVSLAGIVRDVCRISDSTGTPAPEEKALRDDVRGVETAYAEGYDVVESGGGADVDEADEAGDEGCYDDCEEGDCGLCLDLRDVSHESKTMKIG